MQDCKRENNERLRQVKNLEDLVMFKLTTVADKIKEEQGPSTDHQSLDMFQKICDPLLAVHNNYHQLPKKAYVAGRKEKIKQLNSSVIESTYSKDLVDTATDRSLMKDFALPQISSKQEQAMMKRDSLNKSVEPRRASLMQ